MSSSLSYQLKKFVKVEGKKKAGERIRLNYATEKKIRGIDTGCSCMGLSVDNITEYAFTINYTVESVPVHINEDWLRQRIFDVTFEDGTQDTYGFSLLIEK